MFQDGEGDWTKYRQLPGVVEVDFHYGDYGEQRMPLLEAMGGVEFRTLEALKDAYERGVKWVLFTHGASTSRPFKMTARSVVRGVMRSKAATPYIIRRECIQHRTVFVAAI